MIGEDIIFDVDVNRPDGIWFGAEPDSVVLAAGVESVLSKSLGFVSVMPAAVGVIWPWLENKNVDIYARFYVENMADGFHKFMISATNAFKQGANAAQVFMRPSDVCNFINTVLPVRDDLFFNRKLFVGLDICAVDAYDWESVFNALIIGRVDGLFLVYTHENGDKSDFVGRVMDMINAWVDNYNGELYISFGTNLMRIEQVLRLMKYAKPDIKLHVVGIAK